MNDSVSELVQARFLHVHNVHHQCTSQQVLGFLIVM